MRKLFIILLAVTLTAHVIPAAAQSQSQSHGQQRKPRLVVNITLDGMRYDYLLRFGESMSDNGFKKLIRDGALCERAMYDYLGTSTASGIATIATGANPSSHGVIGGHWFDYTTGRKISLTFDKSTRTVGADELDAQVSPRTMIASTIGDGIKGVSPRSKVFSIALDPTSAVVAGGFSADGAYWVSPRDGKMVSSTYYVDRLPDWVNIFNSKNLAEAYSSDRWRTCRPAADYYNVLRREISVDTSSLNFDFLTRKKYDYDRLTCSPGGNAIVRDFAVQTVIAEELGRDASTDYLSVVFNAPMRTAERYGINSMEVEDMYYRLDMEIASLVSFLETQVGYENLLVVLSSTHGSSDPVIESSRIPGGKFNAAQFSILINGFVGAQLAHRIPAAKAESLTGDTRWVLDFTNNQLYLNRKRIFDAGLSLSEVQMMVAEFAIQFRGVAEAVTATSMQSGQFSSGTMGKAQRSYFARHSGDVALNLLPGWIVETDKLSDSGSPYIYDTHVPLIFFGGAISSQNISRDISIEDIAPTIAHLVGVAPPNASTGSPITEIYKR